MREAHSEARNKASYGGIAQLGERLNGIQEVSGSIPLISTNSPEIVRFQDYFIFHNKTDSGRSGKYAVRIITAIAKFPISPAGGACQSRTPVTTKHIAQLRRGNQCCGLRCIGVL